VKNIVRVNCKTEKVMVKPEGEEFKRLGGRALTSKILLEEVNPAGDALGPENKLVIAGMLLSGTSISTANRLSFGAKSPLTGGIKEANTGGDAGSYLARHGIKGIIFEDIPVDKQIRILRIRKDGEILLEDADYLAGKSNYEVVDIISERFDDDVSLISNGIAGERGYFNSAIMVTEMGIKKPCRAAGRGGLGAVMGSKGIKAIVIEKPAKPYMMEMADKKHFMEESKKVIRSVLDGRGVFSKVGTVGLVDATVPMAVAPYKNFNGEAFSEEEKENFNCQKIVERIKKYEGSTGHACQPGCVVKCSNIINDEQGEFLTAGFEYETVELVGPNCAIFDVDVIAQIDRFCDDFGFDTIELGVTLGVYMESGKLSWADEQGALDLLNSFYEGNEIADDFGMGAWRLGQKYGVKHIPTVKGQAMAAYDPRNLKGTGTVYAISTMGADHTCGASLSRRDLVPTEKEGQLEFAVDAQAKMAACDCNVCLFAWAGTAAAGDAYAEAVSAALGGEWTFKDIIEMGRECIIREREFNRLAGISPDQDKLPEFFYSEPSSATGAVYDITFEEIQERWHNQ